MTTTTETPQDVLRDAIQILDEDGWCRGSLTDPRTGAHCALGAIYETEGETNADLVRRAHVALATEVKETHPETQRAGSSITYWNDRIAKRKREVQAMMRRAIKTLDKAHGIK